MSKKNDCQARVESLQHQHRQLDVEIQKLQRQPGFCSTQLSGMKAQKMKLKEEIHGLGGLTLNGQREVAKQEMFSNQKTDIEEPEPVVTFGGKASCLSLMEEPNPNFWAA